jgi:hypothetical protein
LARLQDEAEEALPLASVPPYALRPLERLEGIRVKAVLVVALKPAPEHVRRRGERLLAPVEDLMQELGKLLDPDLVLDRALDSLSRQNPRT